MVQMEPRPIAHLQDHVAVPLIVVVLHVILSIEQSLSDLLQESITVLKLPVQRHDSRHARLVGGHGRRWPAVDDLEWCCPQGRLERGVIDKLCPGQPAEPTARPIASQAAEVDAQDAVGHLRLPVGLRMERGAEAELDTGQLEELLPEGTREHRVSITYNGAGDAVETNNLIKEGPSHHRRRVRVA